MPTGYTVDDDKKKRIVEAHTKHKVPVSELSKSYGLNRKTIYKWLKEAKEVTAKEDPAAPTHETGPVEDASTDVSDPAPAVEEDTADQPTAATEDVTPSTELEGDTQQAVTDKGALEADRVNEDSDHDSNEAKASKEEKPEKEPQDCPNPSCKATDFDGKECGTCHFSQAAIINPFGS